ncbi:TPA: peptidyl-tRNA hydrolase [Clostridium botulinum]|nr:peptidyl-tRNA hydrolase [Clostridium botulinum]
MEIKNFYKKKELNENELVQYYIINKDLINKYNMSAGKIAGQVAHVCRRISDRVSFIRYNSVEDERVKKYDKWINNYSEKKIILGANEKVLIKLKEQGFEYVEDNGLTEIPPGSLTCVGLGVMTRAEAKPYVKRLQLLK